MKISKQPGKEIFCPIRVHHRLSAAKNLTHPNPNPFSTANENHHTQAPHHTLFHVDSKQLPTIPSHPVCYSISTMRNQDKRSTSSRENAKKSTGPKTPSGKRRSSANASTHGAYAKQIVLPCEELPDFEALLQAHFDSWKPVGPIEELLTSEMASTLWRLRRQAPAEASLIDIQIKRMHPALEVEFTSLTVDGYYALAVAALHSHGDGLAQIQRQRKRLMNEYDKLMQQLLNLRQLFPPTSLNPELAPTSPEAPEPDPHEQGQQTETEQVTNQQTAEMEFVETKLTASITAPNFGPENRLAAPQTTLAPHPQAEKVAKMAA